MAGFPVDKSVNATVKGVFPLTGVAENAGVGAVVCVCTVKTFRQTFELGELVVRSVQVVPVLLV